MNDAVRRFKKATDQVRIRFDARQLVSYYVQHLLDQARPLDDFMRDNPLTDGARSEWARLRANLSALANAYNVTPIWLINSASQTEYKGINRSPVVVDSFYERTAIGGIVGAGFGFLASAS